MENYKILIKPSAAKELEALEPRKVRQQIVKRITGLSSNPRPSGIQKLSGREYYRIRQGTIRILFSIDEAQRAVMVMKIGHRREVYRQG